MQLKLKFLLRLALPLLALMGGLLAVSTTPVSASGSLYTSSNSTTYSYYACNLGGAPCKITYPCPVGNTTCTSPTGANFGEGPPGNCDAKTVDINSTYPGCWSNYIDSGGTGTIPSGYWEEQYSSNLENQPFTNALQTYSGTSCGDYWYLYIDGSVSNLSGTGTLSTGFYYLGYTPPGNHSGSWPTWSLADTSPVFVPGYPSPYYSYPDGNPMGASAWPGGYVLGHATMWLGFENPDVVAKNWTESTTCNETPVSGDPNISPVWPNQGLSTFGTQPLAVVDLFADNQAPNVSLPGSIAASSWSNVNTMSASATYTVSDNGLGAGADAYRAGVQWTRYWLWSDYNNYNETYDPSGISTLIGSPTSQSYPMGPFGLNNGPVYHICVQSADWLNNETGIVCSFYEAPLGTVTLTPASTSVMQTQSATLTVTPNCGIPGTCADEALAVYDTTTGQLVYSNSSPTSGAAYPVTVSSNTSGTQTYVAYLYNTLYPTEQSPQASATVTWLPWTTTITADNESGVAIVPNNSNVNLNATSNSSMSGGYIQEIFTSTSNTAPATGSPAPSGTPLASCSSGTTCAPSASIPEPASTASNCISGTSYINQCYVSVIVNTGTGDVLSSSVVEVEWRGQLPTPPSIQAASAPSEAITGLPEYFWIVPNPSASSSYDRPYPQTQTLTSNGINYQFTPYQVCWYWGDNSSPAGNCYLVSTNGTAGGGWGTPPSGGTPSSNVSHVYEAASGSNSQDNSNCNTMTVSGQYAWCAILQWNWTSSAGESGVVYSSTATHAITVNQLQPVEQAPPQCTFTATPGSGQAAPGTSVTLNATNCTSGVTSYQFEYTPVGMSGSTTIISAWSSSATVTWNTTGLNSGEYQLSLLTSDLTAGQCSSSDTSCAQTQQEYLLGLCATPTLTTSVPSPQTAGVNVGLTSSDTCPGGATPEYEFLVTPQGGSQSVIQAYSTTPTATWSTSGLTPGSYTLTVWVVPSNQMGAPPGVRNVVFDLVGACTAASLDVQTPSGSPLQQITQGSPGSTVQLNGSATCPTGDTPSYGFFYSTGGGSLVPVNGSAWSASPVVDWSIPGNLATGSYTITMEVSAAGNNVSDSPSATTPFNIVAWALSLSQSPGSVAVGATNSVTSTATSPLDGSGYSQSLFVAPELYYADASSYGLSYFWPLYDNNGQGTAIDLTGNGNTGLLQNVTENTGSSPLVSTQQPVMAFNGSNSVIETTTQVNNPENFSIAVWFNTTATNVSILSFNGTQAPSGGSRDRALWVGSNGDLYGGVYDGGTDIVQTQSPVNTGSWNFAVLTDGSSGLQLYFNGSLVGVDAAATSAQNFAGWWILGYFDSAIWSTNTNYYYNGQMADVGIFSTVLSASQIAKLYNDASLPVEDWGNQVAQSKTCQTGLSCSWSLTESVAGPYTLYSELNSNPNVNSNSLWMDVQPTCGQPTLSANPGGSSVAGSTVVLTATSVCSGGATPLYTFTYTPSGGTATTIVQNTTSATVNWNTTSNMANTYTLTVYVQASTASTSQGSASIPYLINPPPAPCNGISVYSPRYYSNANSLSEMVLSATYSCPSQPGAPTPQIEWSYGTNPSSMTALTGWQSSDAYNWATGGLSGTYFVEAAVTNNTASGAQSYAYIEVYLGGATGEPLCNGMSAGALPQTAAVGSVVALQADANCPSGVTPSYTWTLTSPSGGVTSIGASSSGSYNWNTSGDATGTWTITAYASSGGWTNDAVDKFTVQLQSSALGASSGCTPLGISGVPSSTSENFVNSMIQIETSLPNGCINTMQTGFLISGPGMTNQTIQSPSEDGNFIWDTNGWLPGTYTITADLYDLGGTSVISTASITYMLMPEPSCSNLDVQVQGGWQNAPWSTSGLSSIIASSNCPSGTTPMYSFYLEQPGSTTFTQQQGWSTSNTWNWTNTGDPSGTYYVEAYVTDSPELQPQAVATTQVYIGTSTSTWPPAAAEPSAYCNSNALGAAPQLVTIGTTVNLNTSLGCVSGGPDYSGDVSALGPSANWPLNSSVSNSSGTVYNSLALSYGPTYYWPLSNVDSSSTAYDVAGTTSFVQYGLQSGSLGFWQLNDTGGTTASDSSPYANSGSLIGGVTENAGTGPLANDPQPAMSFNGSGQYVEIPNISAYDIGNSPFTISIWFKVSTTVPAYQMIMTKDVSNGATNAQFELRLNGSTLQVVAPGGAIPASYGITANTWTMATVVYASGSYYLYLNSNLVSSGTGAVETSNTYPIYLGARNDLGGNYFYGMLADAQYIDAAWTTNQVQQAYSVAMAPKGEAGGNTASPSGAITQGVTPGPVMNSPLGSTALSGGSYYYTQDSVAIPTTVTESVWFRTGAVNSGILGFISTQTGTPSTGWNEQMYVGANGDLYFGVCGGSVCVSTVNTSYAVDTNTWYFAVGVITPSSYSLYVNDALVGTVTNAGAPDFQDGYWRIGQTYGAGWTGSNGAMDSFSGDLGQVAVYNSALSVTDIGNLYTAGISAASEVTDVAAGNNGDVSSGVSISPNGPIDSGSSNASYFNGGGFVQTANVATTSTSNWTLAGWINMTTIPQAKTAFVVYNGTPSNGYGLAIGNMNDQPGPYLELLFGSQVWISSNTPLPAAQTWIFVAATDNNGTITFYINGSPTTQPITYSNSNTTPLTPTTVVTIGDGNGSDYFNGYIGDVAIWSSALTSSQISTLYSDRTATQTTYNSDVKAMSPANFWPLSSDTGTTTPDVSSAANTGYLQSIIVGGSTPGPITDQQAGTMWFYGSNQYVYGRTTPTTATTNWTLSAWFKASYLPTASGPAILVSNGDGASYNYALAIGGVVQGNSATWLNSGSTLELLEGDVQWVGSDYTIPNSCITGWCFASVVDNNGSYAFYLNGNNVANVSASNPGTPNGGWAIGNRFCGVTCDEGFSGNLADVNILGYSLTGPQEQTLYLDGVNPATNYTYEFYNPSGTMVSAVQTGGTSTYAWNTTGLTPGVWTVYTYYPGGSVMQHIGLQSASAPSATCSAPAISVTGGGNYPQSQTIVASSSCSNGTYPQYEFEITNPSGTVSVLQGFSPVNTATWDTLNDTTLGNYTVTVLVEDGVSSTTSWAASVVTPLTWYSTASSQSCGVSSSSPCAAGSSVTIGIQIPSLRFAGNPGQLSIGEYVNGSMVAFCSQDGSSSGTPCNSGSVSNSYSGNMENFTWTYAGSGTETITYELWSGGNLGGTKIGTITFTVYW